MRIAFALAFMAACASHQPPPSRGENATPAPSVSAASSATPIAEDNDAGVHETQEVLPLSVVDAGHTATELTARAPTVRAGTLDVRGPLHPTVVLRIIRQGIRAFRVCYERELARDPTLHGQLVVRLVIDTSGHVTRAVRDASSELTNATVVGCVLARFEKIDFPQPDAEVTVVYPLIFEP